MNAIFSISAVIVLVLAAALATQGDGQHATLGQKIFGIYIPYIAIALFLAGFVYRILRWAKVPVPFRIPTTCGQAKSQDHIKHSKLEAPFTTLQVIGRMALEILFFRSLFRNTRAKYREEDNRFVYAPTKWLWLAGLAFHYAFLIIFVRHFKYFTEPVPGFVTVAQELDGFFQIGLPILYLTDVIIIGAVTYLFLRRVFIPHVKYISLASDYFPLALILGIALSGVWMRYFAKVDIVGVKELATGLLSGAPTIPASVGAAFYVHFFLVSVLIAYFPWSKLMHMPGVFLSPTRNLANNNRAVRHINPWNKPVHTHPYEEYEDEFRELMAGCGLPLDKPLPDKAGEGGAGQTESEPEKKAAAAGKEE
jgi:nitrate reductase gamma subunit